MGAMFRLIATVSAVLCLLIILSGCDPTVVAEKQAKDYCAKQGLQPLILERERTESGWMGPAVTLRLHCIDPQDIVHTTDAFGADLLSSKNINGAMILRVTPATIGARAELAADDVVYEYAGKSINSAADLQSAVAGTAPGQEVSIRLRRGKQDIAATAHF